jgi:xanthine dehydrogenase accessory factor
MDLGLYWQLRAAVAAETPAVAARVIAGPALGGESLLVYPDTYSGSLGNAVLDAAALAVMRGLLREGGAQAVDVEGQRVFFETHLPAPQLVIIGAVHIAIPLSSIGQTLGYRVTVIDARGQFATSERFPHVERLIEAWPDEGLAQLSLHRGVAAVCLAHDPKFEDPAMEALLRSDVGYIGAIGSRKTSADRLVRLGEAGFPPEQLQRIHGPVGLKIGATTPEEIALSIMAEIVAVRNGRDPQAVLSAPTAVPASAS